MLQDVPPSLDGVSEKAACVRIGGSADLVVDVELDDDDIAGADYVNTHCWKYQLLPTKIRADSDYDEGDMMTQPAVAVPPESRREYIRCHRAAVLAHARGDRYGDSITGRKVSLKNRHKKVRFVGARIAWEPHCSPVEII